MRGVFARPSAGDYDDRETVANGRARPSEKLLDVLVDAVQGNFEWKLLDQQRRAYMIIVSAVEAASESGPIILSKLFELARTAVSKDVRGGPGTGKNVLAIQLLAHAARKHWRVIHATGSQAFQTNLQAKTTHFALEMMKKVYNANTKKALPVAEMFCTFSNVAAMKEPDVFDLVVADEAHRLWKHRMQTKGPGLWVAVSDTPMVEEMIRASRVTAFFLDDHQGVRSGEIGHSRVIREHAERLGVELVEVDLDLQFRCNGSESYVRWVDSLLGFGDRHDLAWRRYGAYGFELDDSMATMAARIELLRAGKAKCRLVAGFCWPWSNPIGSALPRDLRHPSFGGWEGAWIERSEQHLKPLENRYYRWANDESCAEQVGSIYSVQGFEFDHVGVIWGEDLVVRGGKWVADLSKSYDKKFKADLKKSGEDPVEKLRSVYRVLLTRGMQGTSVFVVDAETREWLGKSLRSRASAAEVG